MYDVDAVRDRCLILATDGVWNVLNPDMAVDTVFDAERNNEKFMINPQVGTNIRFSFSCCFRSSEQYLNFRSISMTN